MAAYGWQDDDIDTAGGDPARLWYAPTAPTAGSYRVEVTDGRPLVLTDFAPEVPPEPSAPPREPPRTMTGEVAPQYIAGALRGAVERLSGARPSERHRTLFGQACSLARLGLDDDRIIEALTYAFLAAAPGEGREQECIRTIRDGIRAGRKS